MIWTTWRQHRAEAFIGAAILLALTGGMLGVGWVARDRARSLGLPNCAAAAGKCSDALEKLHRDFHSIPPFTIALVAVPLVAGMFWAAPLVSREYEAGTHRLAWTQSVSPLRWILVKVALIFGVVAAAALALGLLATWTLDPLVPAFGGRFNSTWYDIQGVVPVACMLFALGLGVAASAAIRRTIPAMAVTLVAYAAARIPIHWIRWHFAPLTTRSFSVPLTALLNNVAGAPRDFASSAVPADALPHGITITDPSGHVISPNAANLSVLRDFCPNLQVDASRNGVVDPAACAEHIRSLSLHETISYQPASHFWIVQLVESSVFVFVAGLLVTVAVLAILRRRPA